MSVMDCLPLAKAAPTSEAQKQHVDEERERQWCNNKDRDMEEVQKVQIIQDLKAKKRTETESDSQTARELSQIYKQNTGTKHHKHNLNLCSSAV